MTIAEIIAALACCPDIFPIHDVDVWADSVRVTYRLDPLDGQKRFFSCAVSIPMAKQACAPEFLREYLKHKLKKANAPPAQPPRRIK